MNFIKCAIPLTILLATAVSSRAELIPAVRLTDWTPGVRVGVKGGIPTDRKKIIDVTKSPYNADNTGLTPAGAAIQSAINKAKDEDIVYLPAGIYKLESGLTIGQSKDNVTVRGAGIGKTVLAVQPGVTTPIQIGTGFSFNNPAAGAPITAGNQKGSTVLTLANTSDFKVDSTILLMFEEQRNEAAIMAGAVPIASVTGFNYADNQSPLVQVSKVVSKTGKTLTIFPPIIRQHDAGLAAKAFSSPWNNENIGIEDLTIDCSLGEIFAAIYFQNANDSWVKEVKIIKPSNYGIYLQSCVNCEVRKSDIRSRKGSGSNGAGILVNGTSSSLFEDNIVYDIFPNLEVNQGSNGNVFAYNLFENPPKNGFLSDTIYTNHGPHNTHNLYEGNITANVKSDGYFGGSSEDTIFRNWLHGTYVGKDKFTYITSLNRFTRNYSLVGNILSTGATPGNGSPYSMGNANIGNGGTTGFAEPILGLFWLNWNTLGTIAARTSDTAGKIIVSSGTLAPDTSATFPQYMTLRLGSNGKVAANVQATAQVGNVISFVNASAPLPPVGTPLTVWWGPAGYQERDLDVAKTTLLKGNYNAIAKKVDANESLGGDVLPASLYLPSKPTWFGALAWPAINPDAPHASITSTGAGDLSAAYKTIPAGYRYVTGIDPLTGSPVSDGSDTDSSPNGRPTSLTNGNTAPAQNAPTITVHPVSQTVAPSAAAVFAVTATDAVNYQWQKNGVNVSGWTTSTLSIDGTSVNDSGVYTVVVSNALGTVSSNPAVLAVSATTVPVTPPTTGAAPVISLQPAAQTAPAFGNATFIVTATNAVSYQWQRNGVSIVGWTSPTLSIAGASSNDVGQYSVVVSNAHGSVTSNPALLALVTSGPVTPPPVNTTPATNAPAISVHPLNQTLAKSGSATFNVVATNAVSYQWQRNGINIIGWSNPILVIDGASSNDVGTYTVVVSNANGSAISNPAQLTIGAGANNPSTPIITAPVVNAPVITMQPVTQNVVFLGKATFSVSTTNASSFQWQRNGINIAGWNMPNLILDGTSSNDVGTYTVVVSNANGSAISNPAQLTIGAGDNNPSTPIITAPVVNAPVINIQPITQTTGFLGKVTFSVLATNASNFQWQRNGINIVGWTMPTLILDGASSNDVGTYTVVVSNTFGSVSSIPAQLIVR